MGRGLGVALVAIMIGGVTPALGQIPKLTVEGRVGVALPTGDLAESDASTGDATAGPSYGIGFAYAVRGGLYLHLGFGEHRFSCSEGCSGAGDLTATGFDLALRYLIDAGTVRPWIRVGALPYTVEAATAGSDGSGAVSDHTWGFEAGAGVAFPVSEKVWLSPGVRFVTLEPDLGASGALPFRGWVADLGLMWAF